MTLREEFENGSDCECLAVSNGVITGSYSNDYVHWLESKLQNTSYNSDYMTALNEILHNRLDCLEMLNIDKLIRLLNYDIQRLNQRS
jgi:hypothetical protein